MLWVSLDAPVGREQTGRRPAVVIAGSECLRLVDTLAVIVPITSVDRGWPNHIPVPGLPGPSWAMTEQLRAVSRERLHGHLGHADAATLRRIRNWVGDFLEL